MKDYNFFFKIIGLINVLKFIDVLFFEQKKYTFLTINMSRELYLFLYLFLAVVFLFGGFKKNKF